MNSYERCCRMLLIAFPAQYRFGRAEEIVGVLLDMATPGQRSPSWRTAADLIATGLRVRAKLNTAGRASGAVVEGMRVAAVVGLCVQAAFSVAMVSHYAHDGILFYLPNIGWSTKALGLLAALWVAAFAFVVAGLPRLATIPSLMGAAGSVILLISNFRTTLPGSGSALVLIAVQMTLLAVVPTLALVVAARHRSPSAGRRSALWLIALAALTAVFWVLDTGVALGPGGGRQWGYPPSGNLMLFVFWLCVASLLVMLVGATFDPRLGVAVIVVALPVVVYQVGLLVTDDHRLTWAVVTAIAIVAAIPLVVVNSAISLRRLRVPD